MKAKPIKSIDTQWVKCSIDEATHVELIFPLNIEVTIPTEPPYTYYPLRKRIIPIQLSGSRAETSNWSWNGDTERPTLKPSILTEFYYAGVPYRCHSFINDGVVQFLSDCSHEKANTIISLVDIND